MKLYNHPIDPHSAESIGDQIRTILLKEIEAGRWLDGARLPTARELARMIGCSSTTASKALATLAEDGAVDRQIGRGSYLRLANKPRGHRTGVIGVVEGGSWRPGYAVSARLPFTHNLIQRIDIEALAWEYSCRLFYDRSLIVGSSDEETPITQSSLEQVDGILNLGAVPDTLLQEVRARNLPLVCVGTTETPSEIPYVGVDDRHEMWEAVDRVAQAGHRRVGLLHTYPDLEMRRIRSRYDAFVAGCIQAKIPTRDEWIMDLGPDNGGQLFRLKEFLSTPQRPTALVCTFDTAAKAVYEVCSLLGIRIPQDLSVVCLTALPEFGREYRPPVSTLVSGIDSMAREAVTILVQMIKTGNPPLCLGHLVRSTWQEGASIAPPPSK